MTSLDQESLVEHFLALITSWSLLLAKLLLATACGGLIGYQREITDSPAGFRTHILVCVGSAVYMLVSMLVAGEQYDPGRIAAQVASGIGFLGAGTIIKQGSIVRGLTTAASLWAVAGIGLAVGYGGPAMAVAVISTIVVFLALSVLKRTVAYMERRHRCMLTITAQQPREQIDAITNILLTHDIEPYSIAIGEETDGIGDILIEGYLMSQADLESVAGEITRNKAVRRVQWQCH